MGRNDKYFAFKTPALTEQVRNAEIEHLPRKVVVLETKDFNIQVWVKPPHIVGAVRALVIYENYLPERDSRLSF